MYSVKRAEALRSRAPVIQNRLPIQLDAAVRSDNLVYFRFGYVSHIPLGLVAGGDLVCPEPLTVQGEKSHDERKTVTFCPEIIMSAGGGVVDFHDVAFANINFRQSGKVFGAEIVERFSVSQRNDIVQVAVSACDQLLGSIPVQIVQSVCNMVYVIQIWPLLRFFQKGAALCPAVF